MTFELPEALSDYIVEKGFIAIDGVSLTVCNLTATSFQVMLISHTQNAVILPKKSVGQYVNLEADVTGKYAVAFLKKKLGSSMSTSSDHLQGSAQEILRPPTLLEGSSNHDPTRVVVTTSKNINEVSNNRGATSFKQGSGSHEQVPGVSRKELYLSYAISGIALAFSFAALVSSTTSGKTRR